MPTSLIRITAIGTELLLASSLDAGGEFIETDSVGGGSKKIRIQNLKTILGLDQVTNVADANKGVNAAVAAAISAAALGGLTDLDLSTSFGLPIDAVGAVTGILPVVNGGTGVSTATGSGAVVRQSSPLLVTPNIGTPSAGELLNCSGLPLSSGVSGILPVANGGSGVATSTGTGNVVLSTNPVLGGNVGIGTASPTANLHIAGAGTAIIGTLGLGNVLTGVAANGIDLFLRPQSGATKIQSASGTQTFVTVNAGGSVGIGTESPTALLHVAGAAVFTGHVALPTSPAANQAVRKDYVDNLVATYAQGVPYPFVNKIKIVNVNTDDGLRVSAQASPAVQQVTNTPSIIFYGTYSSASNVNVAGLSGYYYTGLRTSNGYRNGADKTPDAYPRCVSVTVTNDGGGSHYFVIRSDGYIEVEFCIGPNTYKRMRWNGNGTNWQYGVTKVFSATMALTSSNALMGGDSYFSNPTIYGPSYDYGTYTGESNFWSL